MHPPSSTNVRNKRTGEENAGNCASKKVGKKKFGGRTRKVTLCILYFTSCSYYNRLFRWPRFPLLEPLPLPLPPPAGFLTLACPLLSSSRPKRVRPSGVKCGSNLAAFTILLTVAARAAFREGCRGGSSVLNILRNCAHRMRLLLFGKPPCGVRWSLYNNVSKPEMGRRNSLTI